MLHISHTRADVISVLYRPMFHTFEIFQGRSKSHAPIAPADARHISDNWLSCCEFYLEYYTKARGQIKQHKAEKETKIKYSILNHFIHSVP